MGISSSRLSWVAVGLMTLGLASMGLASCSQSVGLGAKSPKDSTRREVEVVHEPCDVGSSSAQKIDANNDNKFEIITVMAGGRMVCQALDLNFDGVVDRYTYYDRDGQLRRVESDYDRDGRTDEIALYQGGTLVEKHREMNLDGKLDAWVYYENGAVTKQERDTDGDGRVDEWWQYSGAKDTSGSPCVVVSKDIDGDGLPEPASQMDSCKPASDGMVPGALPLYGAGSNAPPPPPPPLSGAPPPPPPPPASSSTPSGSVP